MSFVVSISNFSRLTALLLLIHRLQGRLLSHLKCFRLQLTQADATWALGFRVALGDMGSWGRGKSGTVAATYPEGVLELDG